MALIYARLKDEEYLKDIVARYGPGAVSKLMEETGASRTLILLRMQEAGLVAKKKVQYPELSDKAWLESRLATGTVADIARELGCSDGAVRIALPRNGIKLKKGTPRRDLPMVACRFDENVYNILKQKAKVARKSLVWYVEKLVLDNLS